MRESRNVQGYNLELGEVLTAFKAAMMERGLTLAGYWMDCPYDYSIAYPAVSAIPTRAPQCTGVCIVLAKRHVD